MTGLDSAHLAQGHSAAGENEAVSHFDNWHNFEIVTAHKGMDYFQVLLEGPHSYGTC